MSIEQPKGSETVKWRDLSDDEIKDKLRELVREMYISSPQKQSIDRTQLSLDVIEHIKEAGFTFGVTVTVSEPDERGQRMFMGMAHSPKTGETINF